MPQDKRGRMPRDQPQQAPCTRSTARRRGRAFLLAFLALQVAADALPDAQAQPRPGLRREKKDTPAGLLKRIETLAPGKERDDAIDALLDHGDAAWPEVKPRLDALTALKGGEDVVVDVLLGFGMTGYDEIIVRAPKLGDGPARRLVRQVLRYPNDDRQMQVLSAMVGRDDEELLLLVLPELLTKVPAIVLPRLEQLLQDKRQNLRAFAIDTLAARKHEPALPALVRELGVEQVSPSAENLNIRLKLLHAVARVGAGTDAAVDPLIAALALVDQREAALDGLAMVGAPAVKAAIFLLRTADRARIETALQVLAHLRQQAAPELLPLLNVGDERTRELATDMLAHIAVAQVRPEIIRMLREKRFVNLEAGLLLAMTLYDDSVRQLLIDLLADTDPFVRRAAVEQLWRVRDAKTFRALRASASSDQDLGVRMLAMQAAVGVGDPAAIELLRKMVQVQDLQERLAVLDTMGRLDGLGAVPTLARQLGDPSDEVFRMSLSALRRITFHAGPRREAEWTAWLGQENQRALDSHETVEPDVRRYTADGREMAWLSAGDDDDMTIVCVSGPPFRDATHLAPHVYRLANDYHVVVMKRGVDRLTAASTTEDVRTADLEKLLATLGKRPVVLLADAAGAHFALAYSAAHRQDVSHVILHGGPWPSAAAVKRLPAEVGAAIAPLWRDDVTWALHANVLLVPTLSQRTVARGVWTALLADPENGRRMRADNLYDDGFSIEALDRAVADAAAFPPDRSTVPTLLLLGAKAPWAASTQAGLAAAAPEAQKRVRLVPLAATAAMPLLDEPKMTLDAIDAFLK